MPVIAVAILPADLGFGEAFLAIAFIGVGALFLIFLFSVIWSTKHPTENNWRGVQKHERTYAIIFLIIVLIFASSTLGLLPYPYAHQNIQVTLTIDVRAQQFQWCLSYYPNWGTACQTDLAIPLGSIVLFNTSSIDVNHGFGLYSSSGQLLDQAQVMPGYFNNIIYDFTTPGSYYVRCLEFCGWGHFGMVTMLNVTQT
jgi:cytochrome c oxidase subunit II